MVTILRVDANLIAEAVCIGGHRSRKAAVTHALTEYIERRKQGAIIDLFGKIDLPPAAEMKRQRSAATESKRRARTA